jgi:hypothetical protein
MPDTTLCNRVHDLLQNHLMPDVLAEMERQTIVNAKHTTQPGRRDHLLGCALLFCNLRLEIEARCKALEG